MRRGDPGAVPDLRLHDSREALLPTYPCRNWLAADLECLEESASLVLGCIITAVTINILPSKPNPLIPGVQAMATSNSFRDDLRELITNYVQLRQLLGTGDATTAELIVMACTMSDEPLPLAEVSSWVNRHSTEPPFQRSTHMAEKCKARRLRGPQSSHL
jgi:hypothetical protein